MIRMACWAVFSRPYWQIDSYSKTLYCYDNYLRLFFTHLHSCRRLSTTIVSKTLFFFFTYLHSCRSLSTIIVCCYMLGRGKLSGNDEHMSLLLADKDCVKIMTFFCCYSVIVFLLVYWYTEVKKMGLCIG